MLRRRRLPALPFLGAAARAQATPEALARFPNGTFLENLLVEADGRVLFTNYFARAIEQWSAMAGAGRFAEVPAHPVSLVALDRGGLDRGGMALICHGAPFTGGPETMRGLAAVLILEASGAVARRIPLPEAVFPNGALALAPGLLLIADSVAGCVWAVELGTDRVSPWYQHPLLRPDPARPFPGVNGIKRHGGGVLLSNSASRQLLRLELDGVAPRGGPSAVAAMRFGVDDFALAEDGTLYAATHASGLALLPPGLAEPRQIPAPGLEGSTSVALSPDGQVLYALGTGGLLEGGRGEAMLARLPLPLG